MNSADIIHEIGHQLSESRQDGHARLAWRGGRDGQFPYVRVFLPEDDVGNARNADLVVVLSSGDLCVSSDIVPLLQGVPLRRRSEGHNEGRFTHMVEPEHLESHLHSAVTAIIAASRKRKAGA